MLIRNNQGEVIAEMNNSITQEGDRVITNTMYDAQGNTAFQNISIRDSHGNVRTTTVMGGKILP